jgi:septal ring factor EnvC (AmiA/AmiB activator)
MTVLLHPIEPHQIEEILKPLHQENMSVDYRNQYKAILEFSKRLQSLESQFADLYSKISKLEQEIVTHKTTSSMITL